MRLTRSPVRRSASSGVCSTATSTSRWRSGVEQQPQCESEVEAGTILDLGPNYPESVQDWWVPSYVIEGDEEPGIEPMAPDLRSVDDLPEYTDPFQGPEDPE
jgi:ABC-type proline/glycine betaine transport system substrate-binding protein